MSGPKRELTTSLPLGVVEAMDQHGTYKLIKNKSLQTSPKTNECRLKITGWIRCISLLKLVPFSRGTIPSLVFGGFSSEQSSGQRASDESADGGGKSEGKVMRDGTFSSPKCQAILEVFKKWKLLWRCGGEMKNNLAKRKVQGNS